MSSSILSASILVGFRRSGDFGSWSDVAICEGFPPLFGNMLKCLDEWLVELNAIFSR